MRSFPLDDLGTPDVRSPSRYLLWTVRAQWPTVLGGVTAGTVWMVAQALMPTVFGRAIDQGITAKDTDALLTWCGVLAGLGVVQAVVGVLRHRCSVRVFLDAAFRTVRLTTGQAIRLGATLPKRLASGEVVAVGVADVAHIGRALDILARGTGSVIAIGVIGVILLTTSVRLGLVVLLGVPLMAAAIAPLLRPLHHRQQRLRDLRADLTTRSGDIVTGLRVLRGIGGERVFADRYRADSQRVRTAGVRAARVESLLFGAEVLLPGLLIALVTWMGARFVLDGRITVGQLVAFYGYAVFLIQPLRTLTDAADRFTKAHVAARRVVRILSLEPEHTDGGAVPTPAGAGLVDAESGVRISARKITAIASTTPREAEEIADRLGGFAADAARGDVTWGGVPLREYPHADLRRDVLVADNAARMFSGRLRDELDPTGLASDETVTAAVRAAHADDIVDELPDGLDSDVAEGGQEFSGGQLQRLRLARVLTVDPEVLVLVEPTSAVDAHTEAAIADRLVKARYGRTTVVCTTSPLVLDRADRVAYVADGRVIAEGSHRELLRTEARYAATVTRGEDA